MAILRGPGAGGAGGAAVLHDTFTQTNGTLLNSYGKWSTTGTGTMDVQGNVARLVTSTNNSLRMTSTGAAVTNMLHVQGTVSKVSTGGATNNINISIAGVGTFSVSCINRNAGSNITQTFTFFAALADDGFWYVQLQACPDMVGSTGTIGFITRSQGVNSSSPTGEFYIELDQNNAGDTTTMTLDNVVYG